MPMSLILVGADSIGQREKCPAIPRAQPLKNYHFSPVFANLGTLHFLRSISYNIHFFHTLKQ